MGIGNFLLKVGKAVLKNAGDLLEPLAFLDPTGSAAAGKAVLGVAADVLDQYQQDRQAKQLRIEMEQVLAAGQEQLRQEIKGVVEQLAGSQAQQMREQLAGYLAQVQASMKQAARYLGDPSATTVPATVSVEQPQELAAFLPQRPPRFRVGDAVPGRPEWKLLELLGVGGFGEVWKAENPHVGAAAFKFFLDPQARQRFATREAEVIKQVRGEGHRAGVAALLDAAPLADPPWLAFEYINGGDMSALAAGWEKLPDGERVQRVRQVMETLARSVGHFHRLTPPVVHRDLKPGNILLRRRGGKIELVVADFGISQVLPSALNPALRSTPSPVMSTIRAYTSLYASPQQKKFHKADRRDDVYALGVIWYQFLRGDLTLDRPAGEGWKRSLGRLGVEEGTIALLNRCWDDEPEERPDDALDLAEKLAALRSKIPVAGLIRTEEKPSWGKTETLFQQLEAVKHPMAGSIWENTLKRKFVRVPAGSFWMGGGGGQPSDHQVRIPHDFYIGMYPVTQGEWHAVMGNNPSYFSRTGEGKDKVKRISDEELKEFPVERVSWEDVQKFIEKLNGREKNSERAYRLPTGAEWEYACRERASSKEDCSYHFYLEQPTNALSSHQANFDGNHPDGAGMGPHLERTTCVGSYKPNALGIGDMTGNVWEWCDDHWEAGPGRMIRGGSWRDYGADCRSANRRWDTLGRRVSNLGFRLALVPSRK